MQFTRQTKIKQKACISIQKSTFAKIQGMNSYHLQSTSYKICEHITQSFVTNKINISEYILEGPTK